MRGGWAASRFPDRHFFELFMLPPDCRGSTPGPGSQLGWHVQHHLPVSDQPLGEGPARTMAALHAHRRRTHRAANAVSCAWPSSVFANRADSITVLLTGSSTAAVLLALCGPIRERARPAQRPKIPDPQAPGDDLNKLPILRASATRGFCRSVPTTRRSATHRPHRRVRADVPGRQVREHLPRVGHCSTWRSVGSM
jgi:hypothetical protein